MARCASCNTWILFGGVKDGESRYCNAKCQQQGALVTFSQQLPEQEIASAVSQVHQGLCPKCGGSGPVDVARAYKVWSLLILTSWSSDGEICCRSCGRKRQLGALVYSFFLGWWGFPWGLVMTPVQVARNLGAMSKSYDPLKPSQELEDAVRMHVALRLVEEHQQEQAQSAPIG